MNTGKTLLSILMGISLLLISLGMANPVSADGPERIIIDIDFTFEQPAGTICSFPLTVHNFGLLTILEWRDDDGNLEKEIYIYGQTGQTWTANGKSVSAQTSGPLKAIHLSPTEVIVKGMGTVSFITLPGKGPVLFGTGMTQDRYILVDGQWVWQENLVSHGLFVEDPADFCAYFES